MGSHGRKTLELTLVLLLAAGVSALAAETQPRGWAAVASGRAGQYSWSVVAGRADNAAPAGGPCLKVAISHHHGRFSYDRAKFRTCALGPVALTEKGPPLLTGGAQLSGASAGMTVLAMAFSPGVDHVRVTFADKDQTTIPLRAASREKGSPRERLRYGVIAVRGRRCIARLASKSAGGETLWSSSGNTCLPARDGAG